MTPRRRLAVLATTLLLLTALAAAAVLHAADRAEHTDQQQAGGPTLTPGPVTLTAPGTPHQPRLLFRNTAWGPHRDALASVPAAHPTGPRTASPLHCQRFAAAAGTGSCLRTLHGPIRDTYQAVILDAALHQRQHYPLAGPPSRTRVSPSGRMIAWTVFIGGESYTGLRFSTRTSLLDTRTGTLHANLETYHITQDGHPYHHPDLNIWGVTFADDRHFYATLATAGHTYLAHGDDTRRTLTTLRDNVECPSLSPDGTRLAFKKRLPHLPTEAPWRLYVLNLHTGHQTPLAEHRSVDDQAVWLNDHTLAYALPGDYDTDTWTIPADGTGHPHRLLTAAGTPTLIH